MSRDVILARRARFIATALAAIAAGSCSGEGSPKPCLSPIGQGGTGGTPSDASTDAAVDADQDADGD
jgi:hypothetical protein